MGAGISGGRSLDAGVETCAGALGAGPARRVSHQPSATPAATVSRRIQERRRIKNYPSARAITPAAMATAAQSRRWPSASFRYFAPMKAPMTMLTSRAGAT